MKPADLNSSWAVRLNAGRRFLSVKYFYGVEDLNDAIGLASSVRCLHVYRDRQHYPLVTTLNGNKNSPLGAWRADRDELIALAAHQLKQCDDAIGARAILWQIGSRHRAQVVALAFELGMRGEALKAVVKDVLLSDAENLRRAAGQMHKALLDAANMDKQA
jgi:hypothetical protein